MLAWHGCRADGTTRHLAVKEVVGVKYYLKGEVEICSNALHGSVRAVDMLNYSGGLWIKRTLHEGIVVDHRDKIGSSQRTVVAEADATTVIIEWAMWCANRAFSIYLTADSDQKGPVAIHASDTGKYATDAADYATAFVVGNDIGDAVNAARCAAQTAHAAACAAQKAGGNAIDEMNFLNDELERRLFTLMGLE